MDMASDFGSDLGVALIGAVLGTVWTVFRSTEWFQRSRSRRYARALEALEAGVERTYRTYVQAIKESSDDGRLTDEERRRARELAKETAILYGRTEGVDVLREVGETYLDLWIAKLVKKLKS